MAQAKGYKGQTMIDFETTFGVNPGTKAGKIIPFNSNEIIAKQDLIDPATITGTRNPAQPARGNLSVDGSMTCPLDYNAIGYVLRSIFGPPTTTGVDPNYTHVFKVGTTSQPSLVIQKAFLDLGKYFLYNGCKVNTMKLGFGGDGEATYQLDIMGATEATPLATYDSAATVIVLDRASNFQASVKEAGMTIGVVTSGEFTLNTGLDGKQYTVGANGARGDIPEGLLTVSGSLKTLFTDTTLIDKSISGATSSLEIVYTANANKSLSFLFPEITYERTSPTITGPAGVAADLAWRAFWSADSNNSVCVVTLKNQVASYA